MAEKQEDELSEEELDSLLDELEQKSDEESADPSEVSLDELDDELPEKNTDNLKESHPDSSPPKPPEKAKSGDLSNQSPSAEPSPSKPPVIERKLKPGILRLWRGTETILSSLVIFSGFWVLGTFLAQWITAGWLVAAVSVVILSGLTLTTRHYLQRFSFRTWLAVWCLVFGIGLVAPIPSQAANTFARYGHWPATSLIELGNGRQTHPLIRTNNRLSRKVGGLLGPTKNELPSPRRLGTEDLLFAPKE